MRRFCGSFTKVQYFAAISGVPLNHMCINKESLDTEDTRVQPFCPLLCFNKYRNDHSLSLNDKWTASRVSPSTQNRPTCYGKQTTSTLKWNVKTVKWVRRLGKEGGRHVRRWMDIRRRARKTGKAGCWWSMCLLTAVSHCTRSSINVKKCIFIVQSLVVQTNNNTTYHPGTSRSLRKPCRDRGKREKFIKGLCLQKSGRSPSRAPTPVNDCEHPVAHSDPCKHLLKLNNVTVTAEGQLSFKINTVMRGGRNPSA